MAKNKIICWLVLFLYAHAGIAQQAGIRERVQAIYTSQLGVREATGHNDGLMVETYLKSVRLGKGYAWCAAFVCWVYTEAGVVNPRSAWAPSMVPQSKTIWAAGGKNKLTPQAGDVGGIYYPQLKRIGHVFFIDQWGKSESATVEGNTNGAGSREGNGVYKKKRLTRQISKVARFIN